MSEALFERLRALGLTRVSTVRMTKNRSTMVSFNARELRVHQGYLDAPDDVLEAIVAFVEARTRAARVRARSKLLSFPITTGIAVSPRRREAHPDDAHASVRLTEWHARLNQEYFSGTLRPIQVRVSRRMRARLGHYCPATKAGDPPEIAVSRRHLRRHAWPDVLQTLLHEMVHQWQDESGYAIDHGRRFRAKAREIGIAPSARRVEAA